MNTTQEITNENELEKQSLINKTIVFWPAVVMVVDFQYDMEDTDVRDRALSDGLKSWANCECGNKPPKNFGQGMLKIGKVLGIMPIIEELEKYYDTHFDQKKKS